MLLVIDIGNTNLVLGVFRGDRLEHSWRAVTRRDQTHDEYGVLCRNFFQLEGLQLDEVEGIAISSVVPPLNQVFDRLGRKFFALTPLFVDPVRQDLMPVRYHPPGDVGADRIVSARAAFEMVGGPAIVVDFGTATTFDAISDEGEYLGGVIVPGINISAEALFAKASRLPRIEIRKPPKVVGDSTVTSMQSGLYYGYIELVEGILRRMKEELGDASVVATGGLASLVATESKQIHRVEENLILLGLRSFYYHLSDLK